MARIPRQPENGHIPAAAAAERRAFIEQHTGAKLEHTAAFSFDPETLQGNIENLIGV